jgi:hypothetical protein
MPERARRIGMYTGIRPVGKRITVEAERIVTAAPGDVLKVVSALASSEDDNALEKIRAALDEYEKNGKLVIVNEQQD